MSTQTTQKPLFESDCWTRKNLGSLVSIRYGKNLPTKSFSESGYPVFGANGIIGFHHSYLYEEEQVLISCRGAYSGKINMSPSHCFITNNSLILELPTSPIVSKRYLFHVLQAVDRSKMVTGSAQPQVTINNAEVIELPIPSMEEQHRIVAELDKQFTRLEAGVAALKRVQANLKRYRAAVLKAACEGHIVPTEADLSRQEGRAYETGEQLLARILTERRRKWQGRGKYKAPAAPDTTKLASLPEGWCWLSVETIGFVTKLAGFEYTKYVKYSPDGDLAVIKAENAGRNGFKRTEISRIQSSTISHLTRSQLTAGDLLMVFVGAGTGNVARVPDDQPYFLGPNIAMIRVETRDVSEAYLEMFLRSPLGNSLALGFAKAVAQPSLSMGTIRMVPVALPSIAEQEGIVAEVERRLSVVEEQEALVSASLQRAARLRQSILQQAFTGALTRNEETRA